MDAITDTSTLVSNEGLHCIKRLLESDLPLGEKFTIAHIRSPPQKCRKLIFTRSSDLRLDTLTSHCYLLIHKSLACVALEILTYESPDVFTIFVSKADTSGHYYGSGELNTMSILRNMIRSVTRNYSPVNKKIRVCLFAKAESQYLFLGSSKNPRKHILSDSQLLKWWIKCLDGLRDEFDSIEENKCTLAIPGITNARETASYFPPSPKLPWQAGDIFWVTPHIEEDESALAVQRIPRFPDDPKSRFLDCIVADKRAKKVTRKQFWMEMQSRQEFLLGKSAGIIGIEGRLSQENHKPCFRSASTSKKASERFKSLLFDLDFESESNTDSATRRLINSVPDSCKIEFEGLAKSPNVLPNKKRECSSNTNITNLGSTLVRKKQKT